MDTESGLVAAVSRSPTHSLSKPNADGIRLLAGLGVEGDAHQGATVKHRSRVAKTRRRPTCARSTSFTPSCSTSCAARGFAVSPGLMGENVTTSGIDLLALPTGTRLHLGEEAVVEVTGLRNPCRQLDSLQPGLMAATLDRDGDGNLIRKAGIMAIVVSGGVVRQGDPIRIELPPLPHHPLVPV